MKKLSIFMVIVLLIAGTAFAQPIKEQREAELQQNKDQRGNRQERAVNPERAQRQDGQKQQQMHQYQHQRQLQDNSVSIEGTLKLEKGFVAVQSGENVYLVPMLNRYIGFIGGLKEGEKVSVEGRGFRNMIQPVKVTIGEKSYDFITPQYYGPPRGPAPAFSKQGFNHYPDKRKFDHGKKGGHDKGKHR